MNPAGGCLAGCRARAHRVPFRGAGQAYGHPEMPGRAQRSARPGSSPCRCQPPNHRATGGARGWSAAGVRWELQGQRQLSLVSLREMLAKNHTGGMRKGCTLPGLTRGKERLATEGKREGVSK